MLFNYESCPCNKKKSNDAELALSNILPANVCNTIGEYNNTCCDKCCKLKAGLERFMEEPEYCLSKFHLQLKCFMKTDWKRPICFYWKIGRKHYEKDVDTFFSNERLIERLGTNKLKPYKSFIKKHRDLFDLLDYHISCPPCLRQIIADEGITDTCYFKYYNKEYNVIDIIYDFLCEYIRAIIGEDNLHYLDDEVDIIDYVDNIFGFEFE